MNKKKIILFDIDYTLFDTDKFRDITYPQLMELLQQEDTPEYHNKVKEVERLLISNAGYEPVLLAQALMKSLAIEPESKEIENLFYDKSLYDLCLYPEVKEVLKNIISRQDVILGVVSQGEPSFQKRKIESIKSFFSQKDTYISSNKLDQLDKIMDKYANEKLLVIDDSAPFLHAVASASNNFVTCFVEKENRYEKRRTPPSFNPTFRIKNLQEVLHILDTQWYR